MARLDDVIAHCLDKPGAVETYPFGEQVLVAKVAGKAFAFLGLERPGSVGLKCGGTREEAAELRGRYPESVTVMDYLGRYGWNSIDLGAPASAAVPAPELLELVDASYDAVLAKVPHVRRP
ncbi:MmcQ/YjbR family DNA-binding protein [Amycolatopsis sp. FDAARGOS 1241]|uniref:MmcQ/YjbR family DNA-binding protein n=1 Tax=Amycolatopsis sp. FDAARGOS 1241 TaxID=2778070 RepID=UPI001EF1F892|nr:MmcQ/YjbR family DNA-binding protein [Amycolatopsis sp. FDAARGOS 1241]